MRNWIKPLFVGFIGLLFFSIPTVSAQEDLMDLLEDKEDPITNYTFATFKNTRLVSGHSIETNGKGVLQFLISHKFGRVNSGWRELYGLDNSTIRLGFEYGITDDINIGIGRSSFQKTYDATAKWKFLKQKSGANNFPFTATIVSNMYALANEWPDPSRKNYFSSRLTYSYNLLLARKFSNNFSMQLMPSLVHRNLVKGANDKNSMLSMGAGTSIRLSGSVRLNAEYYYILPNQTESRIGGEKVKNTLSLGIDLETGGHVFQLHFTNSRGMTEKYLIGETTGSWANSDVHFGFSISRVFTVNKSKK